MMPIKNTHVLVSIGIPVRNGGLLLKEALVQLVNQTYKNIEIIISDNCSSDDTREVCQYFLKSDTRVKYFKQTSVITAAENFKFVLDQSSGDYFMWAAHDDRHDLNYVEALLKALMSYPDASIAYPNIVTFFNYDTYQTKSPIAYESEIVASENYYSKVYNRSFIRSGYLHIYGLINKKFLLEYTWPEIEISPDRPILFYLSCRGDFIHTSATTFYCFKPEIKKNKNERATVNFSTKIKPFAYTRLSLVCAKVGVMAEKFSGRRRSFMMTFALFQIVEIKKYCISYAYKFKKIIFN